MTLVKGFLWCNIKTTDDVMCALRKHPATTEIRAATELKEPLADFDGVRISFERDVPAGHIFLMGE